MRKGGREGEGSEQENEERERRERETKVRERLYMQLANKCANISHLHLTLCTSHPPYTPPPPPIATEVADLNITSTRLASQLIPLHQKVSNLSAKLAQLQCEVGGKREEKERREKQRKTEARTERLKLKRELDVSDNNPFSPT